jgi:adenylate cyclase
MAQEIERHGGTVEKFIGDAVVGVFGAPAAHEDDPVRAVRAAVAMQAKIPELNRRLAPAVRSNLALRAAVHTGEMLSSPRADREGLVTGETTSIASRLQGIARPQGASSRAIGHAETPGGYSISLRSGRLSSAGYQAPWPLIFTNH